MPSRVRESQAADEWIGRVADLFGGRAVWDRALKTAIDAHIAIQEGLPAKAAIFFIDALGCISLSEAVEQGFGMSERTFQRRKENPARKLSQEQSGRAWKFAEILARATDLFGSQQEAEQWLGRPAIGLDRQRPLELLSTPPGVQLIEDYLTRLEYGVYT